MSLIKEKSDELVDSITCYNSRPLIYHWYLAPFIAIYSFLIYHWFDQYDGRSDVNVEIWFVYVAVAVFSQVLLFLSCQWSININCLLAFKQVYNPLTAEYVKVVPTKNNGSTELRLLNKRFSEGGRLEIWFYFQKTKFIYDHDSGLFSQINFPVYETIEYYLNSKGFSDQQQFDKAEFKYGKNDLEMVIPEFIELFKERAIAPFFVFQVFCVLLWCLDEYWYYSLFTLFLLVSFECILVKQQLRNLTEIRKMGKKPYNVLVYRFKKWQTISSDELIPGDLINITRSHNDNHVPCDILLLKGSCIVDESTLTGESVPQMKEGVDGVKDLKDRLFVNDSDSKLHVIFGGTKILQHTAPQKNTNSINTVKPMDSGCLGYVMRTSFNTSQGKLLRTILFGVKRVTENNLETFCFILFLLIFAIAAASYLWIQGTKDPNRNRYKLFLECTLILTSVVPPELPIELSLAVNTSLLSLVKMFIFCTEPFRIPFAGKIEICCFDKTGTLTSDNLVVEGVAGIQGSKDLKKINQSSDLPLETVQVMATCHSLVQLENDLVGDPLEKATLEAVEYTVQKNDVVFPKKGRQSGIKIIQRFHFSSQLKRMSVLASYNQSSTNEIQFIAAVKGAPETLKPMFSQPPKEYDEIYLDLSRRGARVIALGRKVLGNNLNIQEVKEMKREEVEKNLEFVGFAVITTPLKPDSKALIKEIMDSSHRVSMITGDAPLTACYVAKELNFMKRKRSLILSKADNESHEDYKWTTIDLDLSLPVEPNNVKEFVSKYDLCLTGDAMSYLIEKKVKLFNSILPFVKVWARVAPKQKEFIITSLRSQGYFILMCGDGTNDVGALKHAHTGIALIANAPLTAPKRPTLPLSANNNRLPLDPNSRKAKDGGLNDITNNMNRSAVGPRQQRGLNRPAPQTSAQARMAELQRMIDQINEEEKAQMVKLGDASIAAPFTSKLSSIKCVCDIIKQGRCTLVTTLQMFKILALNALILAYCQSVLYLDGVRMNDSQATIQSLLISACFLFISRSNPLKTLSKERPLPDIFNAYTILTVMSQFAVHFGCLLFLVREAKLRSPPIEGPILIDEKKPFEPNLLNSSIYIISICFQINTFAVNYKGHPFMERIQDNKPFMWSILITVCVLIGVVTNTTPGLTEQLSLVTFEGEFQNILMMTLLVDFFGAFLVDRFWNFLLGRGELRKELQI